MRHVLYRDSQTTPSRMIASVFILDIFPVLSSSILLILFETRYVPPQNGTISASKYRPRFLFCVFKVRRISAYDLTRTHSPGWRFRGCDGTGVATPTGMVPLRRG